LFLAGTKEKVAEETLSFQPQMRRLPPWQRVWQGIGVGGALLPPGNAGVRPVNEDFPSSITPRV
jgi:hypothetical protein